MCVPPIPQATIRLLENSGRYLLLVLAWLAQYVAPAPYRFDVVLAVRRAGELLAQLADEDVDDLANGHDADLVVGVPLGLLKGDRLLPNLNFRNRGGSKPSLPGLF